MNAPKKIKRETGDHILSEAMLGMMLGDKPDALIHRQEARGQASLVQSDQLPTDGSPGHYGLKTSGSCVRAQKAHAPENPVYDEAWATTGIEFGPADNGELFRDAKLPAGWSKRPTGHSMWSEVVDEKGRTRVEVFYKAAFYDQKAHMRLVQRFHVDYDYALSKEGVWVWYITDCGKEVFRSVARGDNMHDAETELESRCEAWLKAHGFEDWQHPGKYWD